MSAFAPMFPPVTSMPTARAGDALGAAPAAGVRLPAATAPATPAASPAASPGVANAASPAVASPVVPPAPTAAEVTTTATVPTLTATGQGEVQVAPDQARVSLGATAQAQTAAAAAQQVNLIVSRVIDALRIAGIPPEQIRTTGLTLTPVVEQAPVDLSNARTAPTAAGAPATMSLLASGPGAVGIRGFRASNIVEVTVNDVARLGQVIDAGVRAGANEVQGVSFGLQDETAARQLALQRAVADAQAKAQTLSTALGLTLNGLQAASEGVRVVQPFVSPASAQAVSVSAVPTPIQPGQVSVFGDVTLVYRV